MADVMTKAQRSLVMARIKGKNTRPERYIQELSKAAGLKFHCHDHSLPGKPDLVFPDSKLTVFVDGDFWHGWRFPIWSHRLSPLWREKIGATRLRDQRNFRQLRQREWKVLRVWEHQIESDVIGCIHRIAASAGASVDITALHQRYSTMPQLKRRKRLPRP